jgi:thiamine phosphate synthase YjbQ (UPF0047 family)
MAVEMGNGPEIDNFTLSIQHFVQKLPITLGIDFITCITSTAVWKCSIFAPAESGVKKDFEDSETEQTSFAR